MNSRFCSVSLFCTLPVAAMCLSLAGCSLIASVDADDIPSETGGAGGLGAQGGGGMGAQGGGGMGAQGGGGMGAQGGGGTGAVGGGGTGGGGMGGMGGMPECLVPSDCGPDSDCSHPTCDNEVCGIMTEGAGTVCDDDGGQFCNTMGDCVECLNAGHCAVDEVCEFNQCVPLPCLNDTQDGAETDVDCGGGVCPDCPDGDMCALFSDCVSGFCNASICAQCGADADCQTTDYCDMTGATNVCAPKKVVGSACGGDSECTSGSCADGVCCDSACDTDCEACNISGSVGACTPHAVDTDPDGDCGADVCNGAGECRCTDTTQNGLETDVDCGGGICPSCPDGDACAIDDDCASDYCDANVCAMPTCLDGDINQDETDVDCGGLICLGCADGLACLDGTDCLSGVCSASFVCETASCSDGQMNQDETGVDCGGTLCEPCELVAQYLFEEAAAPHPDETRFGNDATDLAGTGITCGAPGRNPATLACESDGVDAIEIPDAAQTDFTTSFTLEMWVNLDSTSSGDLFVTDEIGLALAGGADPVLTGSVGACSVSAMSSVIAPITFSDTWVHLALAYDGAVLDLFVNGSPVDSAACTDPAGPNTIAFVSGVVGAIDELTLWSDARTPTEICADAGVACTGDLRITEIMYDPNDTTEADWEWIEVYNGTAAPIDLSGWTLDDNNGNIAGPSNIAATVVAPFGAVVLHNAAVSAEFAAAFPTGATLAAVTNWTALALNNTNDTIGLWELPASYAADHDVHANVTLGLAYSDAVPFPNNNGTSSIYLVDITADPSDGANWALSAVGVDGAIQSTAGGTNAGLDVGSPGILP